MAIGSWRRSAREAMARSGGPMGPATVPAPERLPWMREAADALDFLHAQKVIHRDVKPSNLMLLKGRVKVADYVHVEVVAALGSMGGAGIVGTIPYMAPELLQNKVVPAS